MQRVRHNALHNQAVVLSVFLRSNNKFIPLISTSVLQSSRLQGYYGVNFYGFFTQHPIRLRLAVFTESARVFDGFIFWVVGKSG
jgi:hypothetical protein